jgi:hypothetical protein
LKTLTRLFPWPFSFLPGRAEDARKAKAARVDRPNGAPLSDDESAAMNELRSSTLRAVFPLLFSRFARRSDLWQAVVIERFLSDATSLADLEQRISTLKSRQFSWSQ